MSSALDVEVNITQEQLERFWHAEFETYIEEHEGASFYYVFDHDHYGYIGFGVHTCPGRCDLKIAYSRWEKEPHHELDEYVWIRRDGDDWR